MKRVVLARGHARPAWAGHPCIYPGAIDTVEGSPATGDEVDVVDAQGRHLGRGVWHEKSPVRVRIYRRDEGPLDAAYLAARIDAAARLRRDVLQLPERTNAYRLLHGDGDLLPGVVADLYDGWAVLQVGTRAAADRRQALATGLMALPEVRGVWERASKHFAKLEDYHPGGGRLAGEVPPERVAIHEDGVTYQVDLRGGGKTGHYLDQRDNRARFGRSLRGGSVLDVFSGTGGFGLSACRHGGAEEVVCVDSSKATLASAEANAAANGFADRFTFRKGSAFDVLRELAGGPRRFDAVSVDPPRFASSKREVPGALRGYREVLAQAVRVVERGGLLAASSCTGAVTEEAFHRVLRDAAADSGARVQVLALGCQSADHPWLTSVPEGRYLKHVLARVT